MTVQQKTARNSALEDAEATKTDLQRSMNADKFARNEKFMGK
jgi:hypothetical protein